MKYYCPECKAEAIEGNMESYPVYCPFCDEAEMQPIPKKEMPDRCKAGTECSCCIDYSRCLVSLNRRIK